jgi:hypothetical protein
LLDFERIRNTLKAMPPAAGFSGFGGIFESESGMPQSISFGGEFILDSDDNFNSTDAALFGLDTSDPEALQSLDSSAFGDTKALHTTPGHTEHTATSGSHSFSPESHRESSSSGSSRSADSASPKTSQTSGDIMMTDDAPHDEWKALDGLPSGDESSYQIYGDAMDQSLDPSAHFNDMFDFGSASSSPSPPVLDGHNSFLPDTRITTSTKPTKNAGVRKPKSHNKAQSVRITRNDKVLHINARIATLTDTVHEDVADQ